MTRTDWFAGVRHAWALDNVRLATNLAWNVLVAGVTVIAGAASWLPVVIVCSTVVPVVVTVVNRARAARDSREFYLWLTAHEDDDEWADDLVE